MVRPPRSVFPRLSTPCGARCAAGFTLLEVLIAMAILALAMAASIRAGAGYVGNQVYLQERSLGHWVARNALTELQLEAQWPGIGERSGSARMANLDWEWKAKISNTPEADLRRVDMSVWMGDKAEGEPIASLTGFVEKRE